MAILTFRAQQEAANPTDTSTWPTEASCNDPSEEDNPLRRMESWGTTATPTLQGSPRPSECSTCDSEVEVKKIQMRVRFSEALNEIYEIPSRDLGANAEREESGKDEECWELFMKAEARRERRKMLADFLLSEGFSPRNVNSSRRRLFRTTFPLHVACKRGDARMVELLLASGADATLRDSKGQTPVDVATRYNRKGSHMAVLQALGCNSC